MLWESVVTNPPYRGVADVDVKLADYIKTNYPDSKNDLFAVFMEVCHKMNVKNGYQAMITQHAWMFLSSFEKLRTKIQKLDIVNMAHLGARAFEEIGGEVVQTTSFILANKHVDGYKGTYCRLVEPTTQQGKEEVFLAKENRYVACSDNFAKIPGAPVAYWVSENLLSDYQKGKMLGEIVSPRKGNSTSNNNRFLRLWFEVDSNKMNLHCKKIVREETISKRWYPYNKGGGYRKWYGNNAYLIDWYNDAFEIRSIPTAVIANYQYFMKPGLTWSTVSSLNFSIRWFDEGFIFDNGGCCIFDLEEKREYFIALLNSCVFTYIFGQSNPTLNFQSGEVAKFPTIYVSSNSINKLAIDSVKLSKTDWDAFETSWDFTKHPLVVTSGQLLVNSDSSANTQLSTTHYPLTTIAQAYQRWEEETNARFAQLKANEEELNRIFIDIYGLQDELTPEVEDKDVTVRKADLQRDIKSLLSYAVGCMFGRYSLDVEGLAFAGGTWDESKYVTFKPDEDNVIPITDEDYFEDDIIGRLIAWLKVVYGAETLEENLRFIADALGTAGDTARQKIRNYFLKDFFKDHCKIYQKRPIYWLYDSGKQNGFRALIYMHRYNADTSGQVRAEYLGKMEETYESEINRMQDIMDNGAGREVALAGKRKEKLQKQLHECRDYDAVLGHIALASIAIDLDDGVKVNYVKVQTAKDGKLLPILAKI